MESYSVENPFSRDIELVKAVLQSGNSVELPAVGFSMFPTLRPGDVVIVKPVAKDEIQQKGAVIVCLDKGAHHLRQGFGGRGAQRHNGTMANSNYSSGALVMHRLIEIIDGDSDKPMFITRGDSRPEPDKPWSLEQLLGEAVSYKRSEKKIQVKNFVPGYWRYRYNMEILWIRNMGMRIRKRIRG